MKSSTIALMIVAAFVGVLGGFLWWGVPTGRLQRELQDLRASSERLSQQIDDLRSRDQQLAAQLQAQKTRLETTERDLRVEKEMNDRLHLLVSQGKK
jgi:septal ring factor EnvC (AmiA/AmiB activator)